MHSASLWQDVLPEDWQYGGFGLYVHWPFCQAKCPYCDFNSHVTAQIDQSAWKNAYLAELDRIGAITQGRVLKSIFFGGGTPSMMNVDVVEAVITKARSLWGFSNTIEITLEANPTSVEAGRFAGYHDAGVNRISMGIQALNDEDLKTLGRLHNTQEALKAYETARSVFDRVSFDLIYARQNQSLRVWEKELKQALTLTIDHISLYQLTIEDGTAFGARAAIGKLGGLPDDDLSADLFQMTQELCADAGFAHYEISNFARPGHESRHNKLYWQYGDYAGIGPGAHGRLTINGERHATEAHLAPGKWLNAVKTVGNGDMLSEALPTEDQLHELLIMGLRLFEGTDYQRIMTLGGEKYINNINALIAGNLLEVKEGMLRTTARGRPLLNAVLAHVFAD
jgi:oxygen-independent coproporphyrinogen-3 oxidase